MQRNVILKPVSKSNWESVIQLSIYPKQQHFVLPVSVSLSKAYVKPDDMRITPYAILAGDITVGFFVIKCDPYSSQNYWIEGFLVDKEYQNNGYGTKAVKQAIELVHKKYKNCRALKIKVEPGNKPGIRVCEKCGLKNTGIYSVGEEIYMINIPEGVASKKIPA
ncbi:MAG: GNAT family N-acetyltransferase [Ignavibacteriae bacterium]|nr:GNAT family N-acetyltransferase [Ignavibacteriota bacterium]